MDQPGAMQPQSEVKGSSSAREPLSEHSRTPLAAAAQPTVPDYDLLRRIGHGAYGDVWLARSQATGVLRAAKIVWRHTFEDGRPFQREFAGIQHFERISREHPSQLALFHIGRNEPAGYFYYVMELADGLNAECEMRSAELRETGVQTTPQSALFTPNSYTPHTLRSDLEKGRLSAAKVLEIGLALTEALSHLHSHGLVHRDVKPSNVIFVNGRPKLADIGLVTDASDQCSIVGTEGYLPPEGPGTPQADIFALGKVLYEAATGLDRREFPKLPEDLRTWPDAVKIFELNEIILKACTQDAKDRYPTCQETHNELALLQRGKSVIRKRGVQWYWATGKKAAIAFSIAAAVAALISLWPRFPAGRPEPSSDGPDSTNLEANALCDKGMYILRGDDYAAFLEAYTNFNRAIALDPNFARPYVGLLEMRVRESVPGLPESTPEVMRAIAQRLEHLQPRLAATYVAKGVVNYSDSDFAGAERNLRAAIKANPNYELGQTFYGWLLLCYGRNEDAWKQVEICRRLAPSKAVVGFRSVANCYYLERDYTNAIAWYQKAIEWQAHEVPSYSGIAQCLQALGDYTNAISYSEKSRILGGYEDEASARRGSQQLRDALAQGGIPGYWRQQWKWIEGKTNSEYYWKAVIQIHLGNTNAAMDWLEQARVNKERGSFEPTVSLLLLDNYWDALHDNPRFKNLLEEVGLTRVMPPQKK
jgi:serine/threonine protein kinase